MKQIYGIDLAKEKFDVCFIGEGGKISNLPSNACLCAENTGVYGELLVFLANILTIEICLSTGYEIKHSLGLQKGKSDKLDARRIREYGERFGDRLRPTKITSVMSR